MYKLIPWETVRLDIYFFIYKKIILSDVDYKVTFNWGKIYKGIACGVILLEKRSLTIHLSISDFDSHDCEGDWIQSKNTY